MRMRSKWSRRSASGTWCASVEPSRMSTVDLVDVRKFGRRRVMRPSCGLSLLEVVPAAGVLGMLGRRAELEGAVSRIGVWRRGAKEAVRRGGAGVDTAALVEAVGSAASRSII
jgi:hypothetical protein